jgi:hypothetical protein
MRDILNSYSASELRKHISTYNKSLGAVKGYSKMNKSQLLDLMTKKENVDKFKSIKMKVKTDKKTTTTTTSKTTTKTQPKKTEDKKQEKGSMGNVRKIIDEDIPKVKTGKELVTVFKKMDNAWMEFKTTMNASGMYFNAIENLIIGKLDFQNDRIVLDQVLRKTYPEGYKKVNKEKLEEEAKFMESDEFKKGMAELSKESKEREKKLKEDLKKGPPKEKKKK